MTTEMKLSRMTTTVMKTIVKSDSRVGFFLRLLLRTSLPMAPCGIGATGLASDHLLQTWQ